MVLGNVVKGFDSLASSSAWMAGASDFLSKNFPELHTSGKEIDLNRIKEKLPPDEWRELVTQSEIFMSKVVGSNAVVDAALGSK